MKRLIILTTCIIIIATVIIEALIFLGIYRLPFVQITLLGATYSLTHWIGWVGTIYIAIATPVLPLIKRKAPAHLRTSLIVHMIGNLLAVLLVSVHFAHQITRSASNYPDLGTGLVPYPTMVLLVATGATTYSGIAKGHVKKLHFLHAAFALTFYTVIVVHILHGISMI